MRDNNTTTTLENNDDTDSRSTGRRWYQRRAIVVGGVTVGILAISTAAFAYWTGTGSGEGTATAGETATLEINQTSVITGLGPGVAPQSLNGTFTASEPVRVGQVTATVTGTELDGDPVAGCTAADFTIVQPTATNAVVATSGTTWGGGSIAFNSTAANQDACKGVTVLISYTSN
jgi:hypothetical protein